MTIPPADPPRPQPGAPAANDGWRSRWIWSIAGALLAIHAALAWLTRKPGITTWNDDAIYLLLARSLRSLRYTDIYYQGAPFHSQYPPLYPTFLAGLTSVFGERPDLLLAANITLSAMGLALFFNVARRHSLVLGLSALTVAAFNPAMLDAAGWLGSEPLFMVWMGLSLGILARPSEDVRSRVWAGAAAIAAALTRTTGITLVAAVVIHWMSRRQYRPAAWLTLAATLTVGVWLAWTVVAPDQVVGRSYLADATSGKQPYVDALRQVPGAPGESTAVAPVVPVVPAPLKEPGPGAGLVLAIAFRVARNLVDYTTATLPAALSVPTVPGTVIDNLAWLIGLLLFGVVGLWTMRRWWPAGALALVGYGALLGIWPYVIGRYLTPILPLIIIAWLAGVAVVGRAVGQRLRWPGLAVALPALVAAVTLSGEVRATIARVRASAACDRVRPLESAGCFDRPDQAFLAATAFIAQSTPDSAAFLAAKEGTFHYYARRRVVPIRPIAGAPPDDLRAYLERTGTDYVFLSHLLLDEWALADPLLTLCGRLELVRTWDVTSVLLRVLPATAGAGTDEGPACDAIRAYASAPWGVRAPEFAEERLRRPGGV